MSPKVLIPVETKCYACRALKMYRHGWHNRNNGRPTRTHCFRCGAPLEDVKQKLNVREDGVLRQDGPGFARGGDRR